MCVEEEARKRNFTTILFSSLPSQLWQYKESALVTTLFVRSIKVSAVLQYPSVFVSGNLGVKKNITRQIPLTRRDMSAFLKLVA
jgi:hypothetical protein